MLSVGWLILGVVVAVLLSMWVTFTLTRLDRLHARVDAAQAALDAQLVRRAAALLHVAESPDSALGDADRRRYEDVARRALAVGTGRAADHAPPRGPALSVGTGGDDADREAVENEVGRAVAALTMRSATLPEGYSVELAEGAARVQLARRFYNDAVRDTRSLRQRRMPRVLRLSGRRPLPTFFDIDDSIAVPVAPRPNRLDAPDVPGAPSTEPEPGKEVS